MKMQFANKEFELFDGEYRRYAEDDGTQSAEYLCVGVCGNNKILFQYADTTGEAVDFIQDIIDNIPEFALDYLVNVLNTNNNVLVRMTFMPNSATGYEIYYDCGCENNDTSSIIMWIGENNDFAATEFRYTEVVNGHQKCAGE